MTTTDSEAFYSIQQVLFRYCRGVDRGDPALIASVYHPYATDNHGAWQGRGHDFAEYIVGMFDEATSIGQHHITNILMERDGHTAHVESYFIAFNPHSPSESDEIQLIGGRYLDVFECRDGAWKISRRDVVLDMTRDRIAGEPWPNASLFAAGGRRTQDPSSDFFSRP
jgi:hypothetical protein